MNRITALAAALALALSLLTGCAQIDEVEEPLFPAGRGTGPGGDRRRSAHRLFPALSGGPAPEPPYLPRRDAADGSFPAL